MHLLAAGPDIDSAPELLRGLCLSWIPVTRQVAFTDAHILVTLYGRISGIRELPIFGNDCLTLMSARSTLCDMPIRLRVAKLLEKRGLTAYQLAKRSGGAISTTQAYRLTSSKPTAFPPSFATIEALCDLLEVKPGDLFERTSARRSR